MWGEAKASNNPHNNPKEPWEMTKDEYLKYMDDTFVPIIHGTVKGSGVRWRGTSDTAIQKQRALMMRGAPEAHRYWVRKAVEEGKPVPSKVLAEYPDLEPVENPKPATIPIIPNSKDLIVKNIGALPRGTGAKYLLAIKGEGNELVAKKWARVAPAKFQSNEVLIDMIPEPLPKPVLPI